MQGLSRVSTKSGEDAELTGLSDYQGSDFLSRIIVTNHNAETGKKDRHSVFFTMLREPSLQEPGDINLRAASLRYMYTGGRLGKSRRPRMGILLWCTLEKEKPCFGPGFGHRTNGSFKSASNRSNARIYSRVNLAGLFAQFDNFLDEVAHPSYSVSKTALIARCSI